MLFAEEDYNRPLLCSKCGGVMVFRGVGEYRCADCKSVDYDDYGKVRRYLEEHPGANTAEVSSNTGVSQKSIRQMLKESRLEIADSSSVFMKCERCGISIRSGRMCPKCEMAYHRDGEAQLRKKKKMEGFGKAMEEEEGQKRFQRQH